jgi:hypothetical protein
MAIRLPAFLFVSVLSLAISEPSVAQSLAASCRQYAATAVHTLRLKDQTPNCAVMPSPRWTADEQAHYAWCMSVPEAWRDAEEIARASHLLQCGGATALKGPANQPSLVNERCNEYAAWAVSFAQIAARPGCYPPRGPRWDAGREAHYEWCLFAPEAWRQSEDAARRDHVRACGLRDITQ